MLKLNVTGLDATIKRLDQLAQKAKALDGKHSVPLSELLTDSFIRSRTRFLSFDEMTKASGFKVENADDFEAIPDSEWDDFIRKNTPFESWRAVLDAAAAEWTKAKLGLG